MDFLLLYMLTASKQKHSCFFLYMICVCFVFSGWLSVLYRSTVTPDLLMALVPSEMKRVGVGQVDQEEESGRSGANRDVAKRDAVLGQEDQLHTDT